jgi:hypothetical protein
MRPLSPKPAGLWSDHCAFERYLAAALLPVTGTAFAPFTSAHLVVNALLSVSLVTQSRTGVRVDSLPCECSWAVTDVLLPPSLALSSLTTFTSSICQRLTLSHSGTRILRLPVFSLAHTSSTRTTSVRTSLVTVSIIILSPSSLSLTASCLVPGALHHIITLLSLLSFCLRSCSIFAIRPPFFRLSSASSLLFSLSVGLLVHRVLRLGASAPGLRFTPSFFR